MFSGHPTSGGEQGVYVMGGLFFLSVQAIAKNDSLVQETFSNLYRIISSN